MSTHREVSTAFARAIRDQVREHYGQGYRILFCTEDYTSKVREDRQPIRWRELMRVALSEGNIYLIVHRPGYMFDYRRKIDAETIAREKTPGVMDYLLGKSIHLPPCKKTPPPPRNRPPATSFSAPGIITEQQWNTTKMRTPLARGSYSTPLRGFGRVL